MKYHIIINQLVLAKTKLDLKDAAILDYLRTFCSVDDKKIKQLVITENGIDYRYTWINFNHLIDEMPLLKIKDKAAISRRIKKLEKIGFIKVFRAPDRSCYVRLTEKIKELDFDGRKPICEWCGKKTWDIVLHHYPIPKSKGGKQVVNICEECHSKFHYGHNQWKCGQNKDEKLGIDENQQSVDENQHLPLTSVNSTNNISLNNNINNNIVGKADKEFNFQNKLNDLLTNKRKDLQIIGLYWQYKGIKYTNDKQYQAGLKRELRAAKLLEGYDLDRIKEVMMWLEENTDFGWKMETIHKYIDEDLNKIKKSTQSEEAFVPSYAKGWIKNK